jgi:hypothetical protein
MTELLPASPGPRCQAGQPCNRPPCFQARLEATSGPQCVRQRAELCAEHLGNTVQALASWARSQGLDGEVTVLAIDLPRPRHATPAWGRSGFAFATIPLRP